MLIILIVDTKKKKKKKKNTAEAFLLSFMICINKFREE